MTNSTKFTRLIEGQKESGLTIRMFCSNEGIAPSTFYYWQKRIKNETAGKGFIPLVVKTPLSSLQPISPVQGKNEDALLEITYPNGISLRIKKDLDLAQLRALISLLD